MSARRVLDGWNRFWFTEVDGLPFGIFRIAYALCGLLLVGGSLHLVPRYYADGGEFPIEAARGWSSEWAFQLLPEWLGSATAAWTIMGLWIVVLIALLLGRWMRVVPVVSWMLSLWIFARNPIFLDGGDEVFRLLGFYLALAGALIPAADQPLSLDRRRAIDRGERSPGPGRIPVWPLRLVQIQISIVYLVAGFWKVMGPPWWDGSALYYALTGSTFSRFGPIWFEGARPFFVVLTISVAWWEFLFPLLVALRRVRPWALLFGVSLHLMILVTMNIGLFPWIMLAAYPVFLPAEWWRGWRARVRRDPARAETSRGSPDAEAA